MEVLTKRDPKQGEITRFWQRFHYEMYKLFKRYHDLDANRVIAADGDKGEWKIVGNYQAVKACEDLIVAAVDKLGMKYTRAIAIQWWLSNMRGDHIIQREVPHRPDKDRMQIVTNDDGSQEGYRGRQRIG